MCLNNNPWKVIATNNSYLAGQVYKYRLVVGMCPVKIRYRQILR